MHKNNNNLKTAKVKSRYENSRDEKIQYISQKKAKRNYIILVQINYMRIQMKITFKSI